MAAQANTYSVSYISGSPTGVPTGVIVIKRPGGADINVPTNALLKFDDTDVMQNNNDKEFTKNQNTIRILDIFKDAKVEGGKIKDANTLCNLFHTLESCPGTYGDADTRRNVIKTLILTAMKHKYTRKSLIKINKKYTYDDLLPSRIVFQESGLKPDYMIDSPTQCHTLASQVIDPAGRSGYKAGDRVFPESGQRLNIDQSFLHLFGFTNCSITSERTSNTTHNYTISINGVTITQDDHSFTEKSDEIDYFCGNSIKNNMVEKYFNGEVKSDLRNKLSALLVAKEMGDVVQVLTAFIYQHIYSDAQYTITTCDTIVLLLCLLLDVKCITVGHFGSEDNPSDKNYSSFIIDKYTNIQKYNHIMNEVDILLSINDEMIAYLSKLPQVELIDKSGHVHHTAHDFRVYGNELKPVYADLRFIKDMIDDMKEIQKKAKGVRDDNFFKKPSTFGVDNDGAYGAKDKEYHTDLQNQFDVFDSHFRILAMFREMKDRLEISMTLSTYTAAKLPDEPVYKLKGYNHKTPFYKLLVNKRGQGDDYAIHPFTQSVSGKTRGVLRDNPVPLIRRMKHGTAFSKQIKKKSKQTKKAKKAKKQNSNDEDEDEDEENEDEDGDEKMDDEKKDVEMDGGGLGLSFRSHRHRSRRRSTHRTIKKSAKKSVKKIREDLPSPFVMDFNPVYYEYWSDDPGELGEELEEYLGHSAKREWKRVDIHAVLKKQVEDHLSKKKGLRERYEPDILSYMYHDFLVKRRTLFGKPLEDLLDTIIVEKILPVHKRMMEEEKKETSLQKKLHARSHRRSTRKIQKSQQSQQSQKSQSKSTSLHKRSQKISTRRGRRQSAQRPRMSVQRPIV